MNAKQRANLLKLAEYLESLPPSYKHFDMTDYAYHKGTHDLPLPPDVMAATRPVEFLSDCGTVACAAGHGPAAGIKLRSDELGRRGSRFVDVRWVAYIERAFGIDAFTPTFGFLFGGDWREADNHHYGAAARIRFFLSDNDFEGDDWGNLRAQESLHLYAPYRKGSRSKIRRAIDGKVPA